MDCRETRGQAKAIIGQLGDSASATDEPDCIRGIRSGFLNGQAGIAWRELQDDCVWRQGWV